MSYYSRINVFGIYPNCPSYIRASCRAVFRNLTPGSNNLKTLHYTKYKFLRIEKDLFEEQFVATVHKNILSAMST
jgi:hypothetical protein